MQPMKKPLFHVFVFKRNLKDEKSFEKSKRKRKSFKKNNMISDGVNYHQFCSVYKTRSAKMKTISAKLFKNLPNGKCDNPEDKSDLRRKSR